MGRQYHILILALLLISCASPLGHSVRLYDYDIETVPGQEALVFGRVKVIEKGEPLDWGFWKDRTSSITILPESNPERAPYSYELDGDGSFYWPLPAGGYTITDFQTWYYRGVFRADRLVRRVIFARFIIPEAPAPIYIGTLTIREEEGRYTIHVEDEYEQAFQRLKERVPEVTGPVTKRLMQLKERR